MQHHTLVLTVFLIGGACSKMQPQSETALAPNQVSQAPQVSQDVVMRYAPNWPESAQAAAKAMLTKYGPPTEADPSMLIWRNPSAFKRIIVYREETLHRFPILHNDVLEHVIDYTVHPADAGLLGLFNGSIYVDRTRGELSARSDKEEINLLGLNLAHEVLTGRRAPEDARIEFAKQSFNFLNGNNGLYTQVLQVPKQVNTRDPDESISGKIKWRRQAQEERPTSEQRRLLRQAEREELAE